tara:strand:- start:169 stop:1485 length:1317 start_codon:yes stop_codon:yes gene_type:complete
MSKIEPKQIRTVLSRNILADGFDPILDLDKSHDSWIVDKVSGKEYLDMFSMYASGSIGYNHPSILANKEDLTKASLFKPTLSDIYCDLYGEFMEVFEKYAIPDYLPYAFFIEGGALAVENALKVAFDWKTRKNKLSNIQVNATKIIHFEQAFHGRSGYTMSLTNTDPVKIKYFPKFDWPRINNPKIKFPLNDENLDEVASLEKLAVDNINMAIEQNRHEIAAIIIEPIQGEGGDNHFRDEFFVELKNICNDNDILLIMDEVQTGIGITGKMWCHEHNSINPDIISFGKKTQVCGILAGKKLNDVDDHVFKKSSRINSTFGGSLVDMVRFKIILETIEKENLLTKTEVNGSYLQNKLQMLSEEFPGFVTNNRGKGLFCAFDLPSTSERDESWKMMMSNGLMILPSGNETIRFRPHLTVTKNEIDIAIDIIVKSIRSILK